MVALGGISILFLMLAFGLPVAFAMAVSGAAGLLMIGGVDMVMGILETVPFSTANSYEMITIPMFILMAEFVILSGVANDLFAAAAKWVGRVPGGLGMATAVAGAGFGAISGSSTASAATLSSTSIPAMLAQGYEPKLAGGVVAISGTLAMLIPPSIALVLYGIIADVSIGALLVGGIIPGILVTLTIVLTVYLLVIQDRSRAPAGRSYTLREKIASLKVCGAMILLFSGVTGTIYAGIATPTEAAGIGAFGAFLLALRSGNLTAATLRAALVRAVHATAMILMIMLGAHVFGTFFTLTQITQDLVHWVGSLDVSPWVIMALILFGYVLLGCVMDQIAILILTVPVVLPVILSLGFDPVWFGVIVVITAEVGMVTPPMGLNVFVVARYTGRPLEEIFAGVMPHVVAHLILIAVLTAFPQIITWLPSTMRY
ncbi:TRAP transporter large permease [Azospirillum sp. CT11-132]|uniref:TRAP transporter large permease n=1 Tax=unclassified Azospirillum TaxID=2630922 RepID=UPI000D60BE51|nr:MULTISPECIES: TRAP transporter large permease [unclassified Azospirillum]PWC59274.1 C4-dicarboxylate ABC transporter permease [Azospirillum sp. TSH7]PWC60065.1 C4-dicarboxylate ABC transporter permease [Azospirillum sp. TSH20]